MLLEKNRDFAVDAAKGIGIIAVVLGHSGNPPLSVWVNWFHMPLFFLLSGHFFKPFTTTDSLQNYILKQFKVLMPSYFIYGIILLLLTNLTNISGFFSGLGNLIYGGSLLGGIFGPFWFITSFLLTKVVFSILYYFFHNRNEMIYFIIVALFIVGQAVSAEAALANIDYFWSVETLTVTLYFYAIGFYAKDWIEKITKNHWLWVSGVGIFIFLIYLYTQSIFIYEFNVKDTIFQDIILDAVIPLWLALGAFSFSRALPVKIQQVLSIPGQQSLTIMYLHIFLIVAADRVLAPLNINAVILILIKTAIGLLIPLAFKVVIRKLLPKYESFF